jgi:hypothetical protein
MRKLFPSQLEHEEIYIVTREHWVHLFLKVLVWIFFASLLVIFNRFAQASIPGIYQGTAGQITQMFIYIYNMILALALFVIFVIYYLNIQIITNIRIVDIDQVGLFSHVVSELHIDKIEDVTSETNGILGTLFNYGNVYVQTAAAVEKFEFNNVPNPSHIEKLILNLYEKNSRNSKDRN